MSSRLWENSNFNPAGNQNSRWDSREDEPCVFSTSWELWVIKIKKVFHWFQKLPKLQETLLTNSVTWLIISKVSTEQPHDLISLIAYSFSKSLQYSCLENPMNSMKRQKDRTLKDELPRWVGAQCASGDQWRNNSRKKEEKEPKQKQHPVADVTGDRSKVWCWKEQYHIGTWNVKPMNQGKLEVVKPVMARVNVDILGNSKLKWAGMGEFNSGDHYIYYCGQESLRRNEVAIIVNKSPNCSTRMQFQKWQDDLCLLPRQTIQYHNNPSLCPDQ